MAIYGEGNSLAHDAMGTAAATGGFWPSHEGTFFQSVLANAMEYMPTFKQTHSWNALRMSNSVMFGGFDGKNGMFRSHFPRLRNIARVADGNAMLQASRYGGAVEGGKLGKGYSVLNLGGFVNKIFSPQGAELAGKAGPRMPGIWNAAVNRGWAHTGADLAETGMMAKTMTMGRLARMDRVGAVGKTASRWAAAGRAASRTSAVGTYAGWGGATAAAHYMATSVNSIVGARMGGYLAGARVGNQAVGMGGMRAAFGYMAGDAGQAAIGGAFARSAAGAVRHLGAGGIAINSAGRMIVQETGERAGVRALASGARVAAKQGAKVGVKYGAALGARLAVGLTTGPVGWAMAAWTMWDVGKMIGGVLKDRARKRAEKRREMIKSIKGQVDKSPFGMGFVDNDVAYTGRQRGVMAIQNSRLNARSVLGSEAGPMFAHFG